MLEDLEGLTVLRAVLRVSITQLLKELARQIDEAPGTCLVQQQFVQQDASQQRLARAGRPEQQVATLGFSVVIDEGCEIIEYCARPSCHLQLRTIGCVGMEIVAELVAEA